MAFDAPSLKGRALRYLSQREHSRAELARKLARFAQAQDQDQAQDQTDAGPSADEQIAQALDELAARGFQSEDRVAASVLHSQGPRYGQRRLRQTLQAKGLAPELVSATLQTAQATELARAHEVWRKKFAGPAADAAGRAKQARFLIARGFESDVVRRVVAGLADDLDDAAADTGHE